MSESKLYIMEEFNKLLDEGADNKKLVEYIELSHRLHDRVAEKITVNDLNFLLSSTNNCSIEKIFAYHFYIGNNEIIQYLLSNYVINFSNLKEVMMMLIEKENALDKINFLIDNGFDVVLHSDEILKKSLFAFLYLDTSNHFDFFVEKGAIISDRVIKFGFIYCYEMYDQYIKLLIKHGIDKERITNIYWKYMEKSRELVYVPKTLLLLNSLGIDLNESINNYYKSI